MGARHTLLVRRQGGWAGRPGLGSSASQATEGRGSGTSTQDTNTSRARKKKTILTHRGGTFCGVEIQAATRQGGVRMQQRRGKGQGGPDKERKKKTNIISTTLPLPLHWPLPSCCWGLTMAYAHPPPEHLGTQSRGSVPMSAALTFWLQSHGLSTFPLFSQQATLALFLPALGSEPGVLHC